MRQTLVPGAFAALPSGSAADEDARSTLVGASDRVYRLGPAPIGVGAQAEVWPALRDDGVRVAIKVSHAAPGASAAVAKEADLLDALAAAGFTQSVACLDRVSLDGRSGFVMPLYNADADGHVRAAIADAPATAIEAVLRAVAGIARALGALHELQLAGVEGHVVHRDLKPENLLVGGDGGLLLADFGGSLLVEGQGSLELGVFGSPMWAPFDQMLPGLPEPNPTWDTYACGVMLFWWLTGGRPAYQADPWPMLTERGRTIWAALCALADADEAARLEATKTLLEVRGGARAAELVDVRGHAAVQEADRIALAAGVRRLAEVERYGEAALGDCAHDVAELLARCLSPLSHPSPPNRYWRAADSRGRPRRHRLSPRARTRGAGRVFGGWFATGGGIGSQIELTNYGDTWLYTSDGVNGFWEFQPQATNVLGRHGHEMIWNSFDRVALLHGGFGESAAGWDGVTWSWNGTNWFSLLSGPLIQNFGMAFDAERATAMIVGGYPYGAYSDPTADVWEKRPGSGWENRGPGPSAREELAMAFDERRKRTVMVGGVGESIETGETAYEHIAGTGWVILPSLPSGQGRAGAKMVYDSKRGVMVLTGGAGGGAPNAGNGGRYSDTWELWPSLFVSGQPSDATNLVCTTATFSVFVQGASPFQYRWRLDGVPLSDDAHFSGSQTAELQINGLRQTHAGKYDVVVKDNCNSQNVVTSKVATLTVFPGPQWVLRATNGPAARFFHTMAYDSARRVTVLFGGQTNWNGIFPFNDLWEWDGGRWTQRMENSVSNGWTYTSVTGWRVSHSNGPVRRARHAMAYDSRRGRIVMFGGQSLDPGGSVHNLRDLWEWDGMSWHFRATNGPVARMYGSMAYDERRARTILFGGHPLPGVGEVSDNELVWEWDGERWYANQPPTNPSGANYRSQARMTYDSFRSVIVFGPTTESYSHWSFWDWDGVKWSNFPVLHYTDPVVTVLHGTTWGGFAFDKNRRRSTWFGGVQIGTVNYTAFFNGKEWTLLTNNAPPPAARIVPAMAYDSDRGVTVMFGGSLTYGGTQGATNDTWELIAMDVPLINEHPVSQYRVAGETATFSVSAVSPTFLTYQWYHGNTPIPGATASTFSIANAQPEDAGEYTVVVSNPCGSTPSRPAFLTLNPRLQILSSASTMTLIWKPDPAVVLEAADNVAGPWTVVSDPPNPFPIGGGSAKFFRQRQAQ